MAGPAKPAPAKPDLTTEMVNDYNRAFLLSGLPELAKYARASPGLNKDLIGLAPEAYVAYVKGTGCTNKTVLRRLYRNASVKPGDYFDDIVSDKEILDFVVAKGKAKVDALKDKMTDENLAMFAFNQQQKQNEESIKVIDDLIEGL